VCDETGTIEAAAVASEVLAAAALEAAERVETFEGTANVKQLCCKRGAASTGDSDKVQPGRPAINRIEI